ncbi:alpha/beta hydrolase family protein [Paraburkholderia silviterrae]|uniref:Alpha/beta fold hydrolase n=1 Tax=Paraburkholderia silviterrae TaxID=2528715 RepID=A0A4V2ZYZ8_9BURK|nr:alpha/beta fold hydrolase [Paraburkholderia silviterrae]TDG23108.1 alpha/beta fold hydrolase [Paraburkholderia silviterrae]
MFQYFPNNYMWSLAVMRALASGANFGEIDWACSGLHEAAAVDPDGDIDAWYRAWMGLGEQVQGQAEQAAQRGHDVSARHAFMRASIYYQWAEAFLDPDDARAPQTFDRHLATFAQGAALMEPRVEVFELPFEGASLTAYFVPARGVRGKAPVVILTDGLDGTKEEMFYVAQALAERGMACLAFDGPGQGATLRLHQLAARHDSEAAVGTVCDYLETRDDIDVSRIGLIGVSLGGYYAPRAAAFEKRIKACVAWSAIYDYHASWVRRTGYTPGGGVREAGRGAPRGTTSKHFLRIMGASDWDSAFHKLEAFRLAGVASQITCDILLVQGERDMQTPVAEVTQLLEEIGSKDKTLRIWRASEGGASHVQLDRQEPALSEICDWFDDRLTLRRQRDR